MVFCVFSCFPAWSTAKTMWKVTGKSIFPRWHGICQTAAKYKKPQNEVVSASLHPSSDDKGSYGNNKNGQHAKKEYRRFWDDPEFQSNSLRGNFFETVSIVGTAAVCLDIQHKIISSKRQTENESKNCLLYKLASAMPYGTKSRVLPEKSARPSIAINLDKDVEVKPQTSSIQQNDKSLGSLMSDFNKLTVNSIASMENSFGLMFASHDEKQAFDFFKASAQLGCPKGLFNLAICYENGFGVAVDLKKAAQYYKLAASKDHAFATYNLGVYMIQGLGGITKDFESGFDLIKKAATMGVSEAQVYLGAHHLENKKWSEAYQLFRKAFQQNNLDAQYHLGLCYENGYGVPKNEAVAVEMYTQAAKKGHEDAMFRLGLCYENGCIGVDKDDEFSMILYSMLADKGHERGKKAMAVLKEKKESQSRKKCSENVMPNAASSKQSSPTILHTSSSLPEFRKLSIGNTLDSSKSCSISLLQSSFIRIKENDHSSSSFDLHDDINSGLDLATTPPPSFQLTVPYFVAASS